MLALLLLASLAWGTIAEFNHHHGNRTRYDQSLLNTAQAQDANDTSSVRIESNKTNGSSSSKTGAECLICQLHQNLSATVLSQTPGIGTTETFGLHASRTTVFQFSEFTACGHGRAPPSYL